MEKIDTSTEAVTKLLDGVTQDPWGFFQGEDDDGNAYFGVTAGTGDICSMSNAYEWRGKQTIANARFIAAARDLVPALLAERDALKSEVERLNAYPITVQDAAKLPEVRALTDDQVSSACLSYRHDFGLLDASDRAALMWQAREWLRAWQKELPSLRAIGGAALRAITEGKA